MAGTLWIYLPPTAEGAGTTYPNDGEHIWARMRDWTRKPFRAIWHSWGDRPYGSYVEVTDDTWTQIGGLYAPWYALDAWRPAE